MVKSGLLLSLEMIKGAFCVRTLWKVELHGRQTEFGEREGGGDGRKMTYCLGWRVPVVCNGTSERIGALVLTSQSDERNEGRRFNSEPLPQPTDRVFNAKNRGVYGQTSRIIKGVVRSCRNVFQRSFPVVCFSSKKRSGFVSSH